MESFKLTFAILALLGLANCAIDPVTEALIDVSIKQLVMKDLNVPGFGLTIVRDGEVILSKGYGYRNLETNQTVTNSSLFALGSVTKSITSSLTIKVLMELFPELGGGVMDTPIAQYAPYVNLTLQDRFRSETVNFKDLLSHRHCLGQSGLSLLVGSVPTSAEFA